MKLRFHIILSTLLLLSSCVKEMPEAAGSDPGTAGRLEFRVVAESGKTILNGLSVRPEAGDEEHDAFVTGFTLTIPAGTTVTLQTTLSAIDPAGASADTTGGDALV